MKKIISLILSVLLVITVFAGCGDGNTDNNKDDKLKVVTTVFPCYEFVRNVIGENANTEISMLLDNGVDLHSYQPTAKDIIKIKNCDLFVYVGGESDEWVEKIKNENKNLNCLNLMDALGKDALSLEETVDGMQEEAEEDHEEAEEEYDEHIWLSLGIAQQSVNIICEKLSGIDKENKKVYKDNSENYNNSLKELSNKFADAVKESPIKTILFADRFPFRYFTDEFGLKYYAAFKGCSAESEASFETISFLAKKVNELNLKSVAVLEGSKTDIAKTVIKTSKKDNVNIVTFNSMQTTTSKDIKNGQTYLSIMEDNLNSLKEALK